ASPSRDIRAHRIAECGRGGGLRASPQRTRAARMRGGKRTPRSTADAEGVVSSRAFSHGNEMLTPPFTAARMRLRVLLAALLALVIAAACGQRDAIDNKAPIIIISIDTLQSDHLPAYSYTRVDTPALDTLRADSILFERAYSHCPLTAVSHASVFTGTLPTEHSIRD